MQAFARSVKRDDLHGVVLHVGDEDASPNAIFALMSGDLVHVVRELVKAPHLRVLLSTRAQSAVYAAGACVGGELLLTVPTAWVTASVPLGATRHVPRKL